MRRRRGGQGPTVSDRMIWALDRNRRKTMREEKEKQDAALWQTSDVVDIDSVVVPESFSKAEVMRLWYIAHCGPDGRFGADMDTMGVGGPMGGGGMGVEALYMPPPKAPLRRRVKIARRLAPLVLPRYLGFIWRVAGWRAVIQVVSDIALGLLPAWGTFAQGKLVDAVQRSLYSKDVPAEEIIRCAIWSLVASNMRPIINIILAKNNAKVVEMIARETERVILQINLDADMTSVSDPAFSVLLSDCSSVGRGNSLPGSGIPHFKNIIDIFNVIATLLSSTILCITTLRSFSVSGASSSFSTLLFIFLATFPTFFSDFVRRAGLYNPSEDYIAWRRSSKDAGTFYNIAMSFAYKQEVLLFGLRDWIIDSWSKAKEEGAKYQDPTNDLLVRSMAVSSIPESVVKDVLYLLLGLRLFSENITLGSIHVIQSSIGSVYWAVTNFWSQIESVLQSIECISAFIEAPAWIKERNEGGIRTVEYAPQAPLAGEKRGMRIEARNLSFKYPSGRTKALRNINLTIEPGQTLAIVGVNGGGKSTLAKVLTGLYEYEGSLLIDGVEARTYKRDSLHRYMTVCPQDYAVLPLSLGNNVGIGQVSEVDDKPAIMRAVKRGGAEEVIRIHGLDVYLSGVGAPSMAWPEAPALEPAPQPDQPKEKVKKNAEEEGKSTEEKPQASPLPLKGQPEELEPPQPNLPSKPRSPLDLEHRTVALSGGQMQRVAISRAFMRADEAMLVVLDEPSASLDARAEYELFQRIYALSRGDSGDTRTTVYISHRFSTVRRADQIAVVEHGEIIELGSHKQLMDLNGRYAEFFNLQVQAFSE